MALPLLAAPVEPSIDGALETELEEVDPATVLITTFCPSLSPETISVLESSDNPVITGTWRGKVVEMKPLDPEVVEDSGKLSNT